MPGISRGRGKLMSRVYRGAAALSGEFPDQPSPALQRCIEGEPDELVTTAPARLIILT